MKRFCPNCERTTECEITAVTYECSECRVEFEHTHKYLHEHLPEMLDEIKMLRNALIDADHIIEEHGTPQMKAHIRRILNIRNAIK